MNPSTPPREIGRRRFSLDDQARFAALSHDRNPMHVDPVAARRLLTGRPVVHGMHLLLLALEFWDRAAGFAPGALDCSFSAAVNVDDEVVFEQRDERGQVFIEARVGDLCCARLRLAPAAGGASATALPVAAEGATRERRHEPLDLAPAQHVGQRHVLALEATPGASGRFPRAAALLGEAGLSEVMALSYFVGMVCPGLHSVFARVGLRLDWLAPEAGAVTLTVDDHDPRFQQFRVSIAGVLGGSLTAFQRPPPQRQPAMAEIARAVAPTEFKGTRSLVIGGSRGLGELAAKALAAGGGDVVVGYAHGQADAARVAAEIGAWGGGRCDLVQVDVTTGDFGGVDLAGLDAVYYFATPRIYRKKTDLYVGALFDEFIDYYVEGLYTLCRRIEALPPGRAVSVYVPSSVYIENRPAGLTEYAMAKAAAEVLVADLARSCRRVRLLATRLPPLDTDQTASLLRTQGDANLPTLLPVLRAVNRSPEA